MTEMSETEKKRVAEQRELLGEEGLNSKRQRLEKATEDNEVIIKLIGYFTVKCLVTWPITASEAEGDLALIQTSMFFSFKCQLVSIKPT